MAVETTDDRVRNTSFVFWSSSKYRTKFYEVLVLGLLFASLYWIINNVVTNLNRLGIRTGFGFLKQEAGFDIGQTLVTYNEASSYGSAVLVALLNTVLMSLLAIVFATIIGFVVGVSRLSSNWLLSRAATAYVEIFRNMPLLLQIFFWYFAVLRALPVPRQSIAFFDTIYINNRGIYAPSPVFEPGFGIVIAALVMALGVAIALRRWARVRQSRTGQPFPVLVTSLIIIIGLLLVSAAVAGFPLSWQVPALKGFNYTGGFSVIPELVAMVVALSIYHASFVAEIVRGGVLSVRRGQVEAARAMGLRPGQIMREVIVPQALRVIIPPLSNQYLNLAKSSALAAAIAYPDLMHVLGGAVLAQTGQPIEVMTIVMGTYLAISLLIALFMNWYNRRSSLVER